MTRSLHREGRISFRRARVLVLAAAAVALTGACEVTFGGGLDTGKIEAEVAAGIEEQTGVAVRSVECPDDVDAEAGNTFTCTATAEDGSTATVDVTQQDDEGNVRWEVRDS